jgi:hypothetical protein
MAQQQNYGVTLCKTAGMLTLGLFLSGCAAEMPEVKVVTRIEQVSIPTVARPKPIQLNDTRIWVVTEENLEEFTADFEETYGDIAYVALSMQDYENLSLNIADLQRYIAQQKEIIVYYERAVTVSPEKK